MKRIPVLCLILISFFSCKNEDALENEISKIETNIVIERFDRAFANTKSDQLGTLKKAFPFLFSKRTPDSIWINRMNDTIQKELHQATHVTFGDFKEESNDIEALFQHLKYYDKAFSEPKVVTLTNFVKYREKLIVTDTIVLIAIDNYLGSNHEFYSGIPKYLAENMRPSQIVVDLAKAYSEKQIFQSQKRTLLDEMVFFGKQLYFKDKMIPFKTDAEKIGYRPDQLEFAKLNENVIWTEFVEKEMLYNTDSSLSARFIADAPFSKFYLELDSQTPGRLGQYIGWQIVRAYMKNNDVSLQQMLQTDAAEIFNKSNYKPPK
ncbi:gliding motility lipoprotein GldB [uncultured Psychroserpens sp.]|uniref:gliding motility lipoprotein GldB n=1 Tax=uncultured Psychroserpens sp. TaxID=255436 RepID=UPI002633BA97|nr:gliding motility lipoprotein GldB [uncultured Psychroserpens sp.]